MTININLFNYLLYNQFGGKNNNEIKWTTFTHNGVLFPGPFESHSIPLIYNGNKIDCWIYTGATIKIRLINPKVLSVYDYTCSLPEKLYLDIKTKSHVMNHYEEKIKKGLLDIIKGNGHI